MPESANRSKGAKNFYQDKKYRSFVDLTEVESKYSFTEQDDLEWMDLSYPDPRAGLRLDYFFLSESLQSRILKADILREDAPMDHCPILLDLSYETGLPPRIRRKRQGEIAQPSPEPRESSLKEYESMSREELIDALVMARINEARQKKGYTVKPRHPRH